MCVASFLQHQLLEVHPCFSMYQYFIHNDGLIIFHCVDGPKFVHSFIHQLLNICVVSTWELLWIMLLGIIKYNVYMDMYVLSFPGHQFLDYIETRSLWNCKTIFSKMAIPFYSSIYQLFIIFPYNPLHVS